MRADHPTPVERRAPQQLIGSYRVDEQIASGGMGAVYRAAHTILPRLAAIKVLHAGMVGTESCAERMLQEARILESIDHPSVVKVYDAGLLPDGRPWMAMELLDGQSLADHLLVHGRLDSREAARIVLALADALAHAHSAGIVHRDLKPENIMLAPGPRGLEVKLIDWGIAHVSAHERRLTGQNFSPGTPCYMSPEQLRGQPIDGRTDIYALGVVAFEMLTGRPPFDGQGPLDIALKTLHDPVPWLALQLDLPERIDELVRAMMAKSPAQRPGFDTVRAGFASWEWDLENDIVDLDLEVEVEFEPPVRRQRAVSGEIIC